MSVTSGWGRLTYGQANWNQATTLKTGWGAQAWNGGGAWGQTSNQVITLTGQSISSSLGSPTVIDMTVGLSGQSVTSSQGTAFNPVVVSGISASFSVGSITPRDPFTTKQNNEPPGWVILASESTYKRKNLFRDLHSCLSYKHDQLYLID